MTAHAQFEPENAPFFEGVAQVEVLDPGDAPAAIINTADNFKVAVNWKITGSHANGMLPFMTNSEWRVSSYVESLGPGDDKQIGATQAVPFPDGTPSLPSEREYETEISVTAGDLDPGTYRLITVILAVDTTGPTPLQYAAFVDGPTIQLYSL